MNFINVIATGISSFMVNAWNGIKRIFTGEKPVDVAADATYHVAKDTLVGIGKMAATDAVLNVLPGGKLASFAAQTATNMALEGGNAALTGEDVKTAVVKGATKTALYTLNTMVAGPIGAIPLNLAADYAVDKAADLYNIGITTAYNNYKNNDAWAVLPYRKTQDDNRIFEAENISGSQLGMSFTNLTAAVA